ncbi:AAA family ATPase [Thermanaerosceptrum fracticalcis]|uniref:Nuclease SbcCD subunit C n=1 Tax=Thermanaerosceptrum fracticalcis TaxID=1712410 RepID=A0A7G6E7A0_THEFR|nr:SMC family ATPase [Thermanaerosceptrum fracticalcis]QNB47954.1 AAA family ATPase [Thermanaerosceptrum fracticalcis]
MKPIRLKFSGLQSYREEQEINFVELGSLGLFGIFGPTGSGKSTILDAVTLALFGNVERAVGGTKGIMNHFAERLFVSFEFLLGQETYLVERSYVRNKHDDESVLNKGARLVKTGSTVEVLADKATDVTETIERLLGMTFKDFTRAVILPQNKFDQFLKLTEGERAKMLEKIFCLEEFGEELLLRAKNLEAQLQQEIHTNVKLMTQLGDVSDEVIQKIREELQAKKEEIKKKEALKKELENKLKELEQLARIYEEIAVLAKERERLEGMKPQIAGDKVTLERAQKAEPLRSLFNQLEDLFMREQAEAKILAERTGKDRAAEEIFIEAQERLNKAREGQAELNHLKEEDLPKINVAGEYEKQVLTLQAELNNIRNALKATQIEIEKTTALGLQKKAMLEQLETKLKGYEQGLKDLFQVLACREEIDRVLSLLSELENAEKLEREASSFLEEREKVLKREEEELKLILAEKREYFNVDPLKVSISQFMEMLPALLGKVSTEQLKAEELYDHLVYENMAQVLAEKLTENEPCPVCGSAHHPKPAGKGVSSEELGRAKQVVLKLKEELEKLRPWTEKVNIKFNKFQHLQDDVQSLHLPNYEARVKAANLLRHRFIEETVNLKNTVRDILPAALHKPERDMVRMLKEHLVKADGQLKVLTEQKGNLEQQKITVEKDMDELRAKLITLKADKVNLEKNVQALENSLTELEHRLRELLGGLDLAEFAGKVRKRMGQLEQELSEAEKEWQEAAKRKQETAEALAESKVSLLKTREHLAKIRADLSDTAAREGFKTLEEIKEALLDSSARAQISQRIQEYEKNLNHVEQTLLGLEAKIIHQPFNLQEMAEQKELLHKVNREYNEDMRQEGALQKELEDLQAKQITLQELETLNQKFTGRKELVGRLLNLLKGRRFVQFLAAEHLRDMAGEASIRLGTLTGQRFALELDEGCGFVMRDDYSGGQRRPVNTLSGGETFLTSLSLALALSSKIQLKGKYPLGFFFLDEGFGTLDPEKLELVMGALEKLHDAQRMVGVITHVPELKSRMPRYLEVIPAKQDGTGSRVVVKIN